ncbi:MAG: RNA polymerase sigma factor [bacterium]
MKDYCEQSDAVLIDLIHKGDSNAFEALYDRYSSKVLKQCYLFCLNTDQANDLMHDVWIKIFFNIKSFKKEASLSTWIYRITTNHCLNHMKKKSEISLDELEMEIPYSNGKEIGAEVKRILSRLTLEDRALLVMKYMDELTYEEISLRLDSGVSAIKMRLSRLIKEIRKEIVI